MNGYPEDQWVRDFAHQAQGQAHLVLLDWRETHRENLFEQPHLYVYTAQMAVHCPDGYIVVDTTMKSATGDAIWLAPTKTMVHGHKYLGWSDERYIADYLALMRNNYRQHPEALTGLLHATTPVVLKCYCRAGEFCHRHLLVGILRQIATHNHRKFTYMGEIV